MTEEGGRGLGQALVKYNNDLILLLHLRRRRKKIAKREWVRVINRRRKEQGEYHNLVQEMRIVDHESFYISFRMDPTEFDEVLSMVGPLIKKKDTYFREAISPGERLAITLRYLATGDAMQTIALSYRVGSSTVSKVILTTLKAIWEVMSPIYIKPPNSLQWEKMAIEFEDLWQFPNCIGSIDGKHVQIQAPNNTGSVYFNYKNTFSIVLLAVCDAKYRFTLVDIGATGRGSDGGVFNNSAFGQALQESKLDIPPPREIKGSKGVKFPFTLVGDEAFPLRSYLMRPFPGRALINMRRKIYNYRLSRVRRVIENAFRILSTKWRIYRRPIVAKLETAEGVIQATICLHNFLKTREDALPAKDRKYCPAFYTDNEDSCGNVTPGEWRTKLKNGGVLNNTRNLSSNTHSKDAEGIREYYAQYFESKVGQFNWQVGQVLRGRSDL